MKRSPADFIVIGLGLLILGVCGYVLVTMVGNCNPVGTGMFTMVCK